MQLNIGDHAPEFALKDQEGHVHKLSDYEGGWVLLYFYPKDDTPGCTLEACTIRDAFPDFSKLDISVIGISADDEKSHARFAKKYELPFTLLSDPEHGVLEQYSVWQQKKMMGRLYMGIMRTSFLINPQGEIAKVYEGVKPAQHAGDVLHDVRRLRGLSSA